MGGVTENQEARSLFVDSRAACVSFFFSCPVDVIRESNWFSIQEYDGL
jgi:hypothetical protein